MPIYFFWGADEFRLKRAVATLRDRTLDPAWASFNFDRIGPEVSEGPTQALNQAMTPPFGTGGRFVWLYDTTLGQRCPDDLTQELARTLPRIPETTVLLLTSEGKPDGRLKSTKLLNQYAEVREFAAIAPWQSDQLVEQVQRVAKELQLRLKPQAAELMADAVGADTRRLYNEMEKLSLYWSQQGRLNTEPLPAEAITELVKVSTQTSFQLAEALIAGKTARALGLVSDLLANNEPALKIVATLVSQFRLWLWVSLLAAEGERDARAIAKAAEIKNPKRVYILQKQVRGCSPAQLQRALTLLLELEYALKRGAPEEITLHTKVMELASHF